MIKIDRNSFCLFCKIVKFVAWVSTLFRMIPPIFYCTDHYMWQNMINCFAYNLCILFHMLHCSRMLGSQVFKYDWTAREHTNLTPLLTGPKYYSLIVRDGQVIAFTEGGISLLIHPLISRTVLPMQRWKYSMICNCISYTRTDALTHSYPNKSTYVNKQSPVFHVSLRCYNGIGWGMNIFQ